MKDKFKTRLKQVLLISLFFWLFFILFQLLKTALLAEYDIQYYFFGKALVAALVIGKVVALTDHTNIIKKFDHKPKIYSVLFRTMVYMLAYVIFSFFEILIKRLFHGAAFSEALLAPFQKMSSKFYLVELFVYLLAFLLFNIFWVIRNYIGGEKLFRLFFKKETL
jgi:hypothetical protein